MNLTPRHREVVALIAEGYSAKEIAVRLFMSIHTVQNHTRAAKEATGSRNSAHLAAKWAAAQADLREGKP